MVLFFHGDHYEGAIKARDRTYFFRAYVTDDGKWTPNDMAIDGRLFSHLGDKLHDFIEENHKETSFPDFFNKLEAYLKSSLGEQSQYSIWIDNPIKTYNLYYYLGHELQSVNQYITDINLDSGIINIKATDTAGRVHVATLKITENYPVEPVRVVSHDLPLDNQNQSLTVDVLEPKTITNFCKNFVQCLKNFQTFWDRIAILDVNCWVLDPENPTYGDIMRKIKISNRISVVLTFNPCAVWQIPHIRFVGCHSTVVEFKEILQKNLQNSIWDPQTDLLTNLMNILEVTFPVKEEHKDDMNLVQSGECVICFMVRLEDEMPSVICDNDNCLSNYHATCLSKYLISTVQKSINFGKINGKCPNCEEEIFCPVPDKY